MNSVYRFVSMAKWIFRRRNPQENDFRFTNRRRELRAARGRVASAATTSFPTENYIGHGSFLRRYHIGYGKNTTWRFDCAIAIACVSENVHDILMEFDFDSTE